MFCPNCGYDCGSARFCPGCGTALPLPRGGTPAAAPSPEDDMEIPACQPLDKPCVARIHGVEIDLNKVIRCYGTGWRSVGAYAYLANATHIPQKKAKEILDPLIEYHKGAKISGLQAMGAQRELDQVFGKKGVLQKKKKAADEQGLVCCPKCGSTSVSTEKAGFQVGTAVVGGLVAGPAGAMMGHAGSSEIHCVCLKCGYKWKPGKK